MCPAAQASNRRRAGEDCSRLYSTLEDYGDHELVLNGVHENVLGLAYLDPQMLGTVRVFDHLHHADLLLTTARRRLDFGLMAYVPAPLLSVHATVAQYGRSVALSHGLQCTVRTPSTQSPIPTSRL